MACAYGSPGSIGEVARLGQSILRVLNLKIPTWFFRLHLEILEEGRKNTQDNLTFVWTFTLRLTER